MPNPHAECAQAEKWGAETLGEPEQEVSCSYSKGRWVQSSLKLPVGNLRHQRDSPGTGMLMTRCGGIQPIFKSPGAAAQL